MLHIVIDVNTKQKLEELKAWMRRQPLKAAVPPPSPVRVTKSITMLSRDVVVIPPAIWPEPHQPAEGTS